jgi:hypothetical protein
MAIAEFIPEIWSAELLSSLKKAQVYAQPGVVNRNYEGEIAQSGDTVHITSISRPTIATYTKDSTTITPETLTDAQRALVIDQAKYFAFEIDDIDMRQAKDGGALMSEAASEAAYGLADLVDQLVAGLYTLADSGNAISTTSITTAALAVTGLINLGVKLDAAGSWCRPGTTGSSSVRTCSSASTRRAPPKVSATGSSARRSGSTSSSRTTSP